jgi:crossover junction endodeoxyribonuclease RuvC
MTVPPLIIGVDPGLTGAVAVLGPAGEIEHLADLPVIHDGRLAWIDGGALQTLLIETVAGRPARAVVERVGAMPRQGVASAFTFGVTFGSILAVLQARQIAIELVTPAVWKRALGLGSDKRASLDKARLLFPAADLRLAKHDGRAEALLLAHWASTRSMRAAA